MTLKEALYYMEIERKCIVRNKEGKCDRDCDNCDLVQETDDLLLAYDVVITTIKTKLPKPYERWVPCTCGCNRREQWFRAGGTTGVRCIRCHREVEGSSFADAKRKWNKIITSLQKDGETE